MHWLYTAASVCRICRQKWESAKIIRLLDVLIPKLTPEHTVCRTTTGEVITSLHSLSLLVEELSSKEDLFFSIQKRQTLNSAAIIVHRVTDFLEHVKKSFSKFDHVCSKDKDTNKGVLNMIGELMNDLALLYAAVGGETAAAEIRQQGDIATSLVVSLSNELCYQMDPIFLFHSGQHKQVGRC